jgi:hypothetical protein
LHWRRQSDSQIETKGIISNKSTHIVSYADGVVTVGRSTDELKKTKKKVMKTEQVMGLNGQHAEDKRH